MELASEKIRKLYKDRFVDGFRSCIYEIDYLHGALFNHLEKFDWAEAGKTIHRMLGVARIMEIRPIEQILLELKEHLQIDIPKESVISRGMQGLDRLLDEYLEALKSETKRLKILFFKEGAQTTDDFSDQLKEVQFPYEIVHVSSANKLLEQVKAHLPHILVVKNDNPDDVFYLSIQEIEEYFFGTRILWLNFMNSAHVSDSTEKMNNREDYLLSFAFSRIRYTG